MRLSRYCDCQTFVTVCMFLLLFVLPGGVYSCGPGRGMGRRRRPRKLTPLVFKQHVPNVSENTLGASGKADGKLRRADKKFKDLVRNDNPDIIFKDEESTGADRLMSQRCKDKVNILSISVMNQWPKVRLRVIEAWDEDAMHAVESLHYEGRAVDITTSDKDKAKYGMLARLAVEAGFDWVYYESRGHIHCSVKSDSSVAIEIGGCFSAFSTVLLEDGTIKRMADVQTGDEVLSVDHQGKLVYSTVLTFLDRQPDVLTRFYVVQTEVGQTLTLTAKHLVYVANDDQIGNYNNSTYLQYDTNMLLLNSFRTTFAENVDIGSYLLGFQHKPTQRSDYLPRAEVARVTRVSVSVERGAFAPLTRTGTVLVDRVLVSCYAQINKPQLAHAVFAPLRFWHDTLDNLYWLWSKTLNFRSNTKSLSYSDRNATTNNVNTFAGVHAYAKVLSKIGSVVLSRDMLHVP